MKKYTSLKIACAAILMVSGCTEKAKVDDKKAALPPEYTKAAPIIPPPPSQAMELPVLHVEQGAQVGIDFVHNTGATGKKLMPETMGPGCALFDYNNDGQLDALFPDGHVWDQRTIGKGKATKTKIGKTALARLYRNNGGQFKEVTAAAGLDRISGYGMGVAAADYDADGDTDLVITTVEGSHLLRNDKSIYQDVTKASGLKLAAPEWATSAAWLDADKDGRLDLFVANYVKWSQKTDLFTTLDGTHKSYATPKVYQGLTNRFFRNLGNGKFADVSEEAGFTTGENKALGVVVLDANDDSFPDLFVSNDTVANKLYINDGKGHFSDTALSVGVGYDEQGEARAGMGVDSGQANNGVQAIIVGNFSDEPVALYERTAGGHVFIDAAQKTGLATETLPRLTFGSRFADLNDDGRDDLILANGHIEPEIQKVQSAVSYKQPIDVFVGQESGRFQSLAAASGKPLGEPVVGRCVAFGDIDNDGDLDGLVSVNGGSPVILRNATGGERAVLIDLHNPKDGNIEALGAEVTLIGKDWTRREIVRARGSYLGHSPYTLHFGIPRQAGDSIGVKVRWPDGSVEDRGTVQSGNHYRINKQGELTTIKLEANRP